MWDALTHFHTRLSSACTHIWSKVKSLSRVRLCDPMDCSLQGSSVHGVFQARVLDWVAISFSRGSSQLRDRTWVSHIARRHFTVWATREALKTCGNKEATLTSSSSTLAQDLSQKIWEWSPVIRVLKSLAGDPDVCWSLKTNDLDPCLTNFFSFWQTIFIKGHVKMF